MSYRQLIKHLRVFRDDTRGYVSLEAMIVLPALLWIFGAGWVYFDAMHQQSVNQKANYTISDMISRETDAITGDYVANAHRLLQIMTKSEGEQSALRITVVEFDGSNWTVAWSRSGGPIAAMQMADLADYLAKLPLAAAGEQLVLLETWDSYDPVIQVGLDAFDIRSYSFTRPRYAPQIVLAEGA